MDAKHPNRKKDPQNPYTLVRTETVIISKICPTMFSMNFVVF